MVVSLKALFLPLNFWCKLFIAWLNPIPLRVLKRQLLLAAIRKNMVNCTAALRVVPGASRHTVQEIMHQLTHEKVRIPLLPVQSQNITIHLGLCTLHTIKSSQRIQYLRILLVI
jgi:hypothetical protein